MQLLNYSNLAPPLSLSSGVTAAATTLTVSSTTGYPDAPFLLGLERGTDNEEVVLCTAKSATTFTVTRAYDGTTAKSHGTGTLVEHTVAALVFRGAGIVGIDTATRDSLTGDNLWAGRTIWNTTGNSLEVFNGSTWGKVGSDSIQTFGKEGTLTVSTGKGRFPLPYDIEVLGVQATVNTAPTGASVIVDVLENGTSLYSSNPGSRPTIPAGSFVSPETAPSDTLVAQGNYLTVNVVQVGSTVAGADLQVNVRYRRA